VHSELTFHIRHLLGRVAGTFRDWSGTVAMDSANPANSKVSVDVKTASIETLKAERDTHLRTPDFFAVEGRFKDPWGKMRTAFTGSTTINRQDFGVSFNGPFEKIGQIGDDVAISIAIGAVEP
jgi:polyisoprenoid-binding protein YceI